MKILRWLCMLAVVSVCAYGQGGRFGDQNPTQTVVTIPGTIGQIVKVIPNAIVSFCTAPANAVPCTNKATTYTDITLGTLCSTSTQVVLAGSSSCVGTSDSLGNWGVWVQPGYYEYTITVSGNGTSYGPFPALVFASTGVGGPNISCVGVQTGGLAAWLSATSVGCDNQSLTDFLGHLNSQSYQAVGPQNGEVQFTTIGVFPTSALPAGTIGFTTPSSIATSFRVRLPSAIGTDGQVLQQLSHGVDGTGTNFIALNWFTPGAAAAAPANTVVGNFTNSSASPINNAMSACGDSTHALKYTTGTGFGCQLISTGTTVEVQTNGVDNTSQALLNHTNGTAAFGFQVTPVNPSGGIDRFDIVTPYTTASNPTAPTLTPTNPGSTPYTYGVAGCEDPGCTRHSALVTTTTSTGNATLNNTNPIKLTAYADTLYGYRFYVICRTASSGSPASVGVIGSGAWKQFSDNGITADGTTCGTTYATNNTKLDDHCLGGNPSIANAALSVPCGTDTPPASPNALDDEGTGTTFAPGDANSPFWTWVNQNSATSAYTGGTLTLNSPSRAASDNLNCLVQTAPATPYTFTALIYEDFGYTDGSVVRTINAQHGVVFRESGTSKLMTWGGQAHTTNVISALLTEWTNTTTQNGTFPVSSNGLAMNPSFWRIQNDGTNINFSSSTDGITYVTQFSQAKNAFFTTAPDQVGICIDNNAGETALALDYWRRTQ